jgi:hypothetical protein
LRDGVVKTPLVVLIVFVEFGLLPTGSARPTNQIFPTTRPRSRLSISPRTTCSSMRQAMMDK